MGWMGMVTRTPFDAACWETASGLGSKMRGSIFSMVVFFALCLTILRDSSGEDFQRVSVHLKRHTLVPAYVPVVKIDLAHLNRSQRCADSVVSWQDVAWPVAFPSYHGTGMFPVSDHMIGSVRNGTRTPELLISITTRVSVPPSLLLRYGP